MQQTKAKKTNLVSLVPGFLKPVLRPLYNVYVKMVNPSKSRTEIHQYWKQPWDGSNLPQEYLKGEERSRFLLEIIKKHVAQDAKIIEIGCNVGRNLNHLFSGGFRSLSGIEISANAVELLRKSYPEMGECAQIFNMPVEEKIKGFKDGAFDVVFTMAVLEHIHTDSEWIFAEMARIVKGFLIVIEDEGDVSWRHFPRNYKNIFEPLGMKQVEEINCEKIEGLGGRFIARVFQKRQ